MTDLPASVAAPHETAPTWRREPYRVFFPLGIALTWAGVLPWLFFALGWSRTWPAVVHSIVQVQGFLMCFAAGFLFTMLPRRTRTAAPAVWQMVVVGVAPLGIALGSWLGWLVTAQVFWLAWLGTVAFFIVQRRGAGGGRRPPDAFVWLPAALAMGAGGTVVIAAYGIGGLDFAWHEFGAALLLEAMTLALIVGVGSMVLPLITRGEASTDGDPARPGPRRLHALAAVALAGTCALEAFVEARLGLALRAGLALVLLVGVARIHRPPTVAGAHRRLVWVAAWALPVGFALAAALPPSHVQIGKHVVFVLGFGLMALAVGLHVSLAHGGRQDLARGRPWQVSAFAMAILLAAAARTAMVLDPGRLLLWLGVAASSFLLATSFWLVLALVPVFGRRPASS